jgi:hypothetical protein
MLFINIRIEIQIRGVFVDRASTLERAILSRRMYALRPRSSCSPNGPRLSRLPPLCLRPPAGIPSSSHWVLRWTSAGGARSPSAERLRRADAPQDRRRPLGAGVSSSPQDWCDSRPSVAACEGDSDDPVSPPPPDLPLLPLVLLIVIRFHVFSFSTTATGTGVCVAHFTRGLRNLRCNVEELTLQLLFSWGSLGPSF